MSAGADEKTAVSLFGRFITHRQSLWITMGVCLLLFLAPIGAAYLDGVGGDFFSGDIWRPSLLPPTVIVYILVVSPMLARMGADVVEAFRPLVLMGDDEFERLVDTASRPNPRSEWIFFGIGAALGLWVGWTWVLDGDIFWLRLYLPLPASLMFGLLGWTVYAAVVNTRLTAELHRQPLRFDIFDIRPFVPIGRQSLVLALVFVGGIVLSTLFSIGQLSILDWRNWLVEVPILLFPVLVFFLNMRGTHHVLAAEKKRELEAVQRNILLACRTLMARFDSGEDSGTLGAEINALVAYEARFRTVSTWPYNTAMLRTLFFSVVLPLGAALGQEVIKVLVQ